MKEISETPTLPHVWKPTQVDRKWAIPADIVDIAAKNKILDIPIILLLLCFVEDIRLFTTV